jgi:hypothetical protein
MMKWAKHVARTERKTYIYRSVVEKPGGRRPVGRIREFSHWTQSQIRLAYGVSLPLVANGTGTIKAI